MPVVNYTINVAPYADLDYVDWGYTGDGFLLAGSDAELRSTGGLQALTGSFTLTGQATIVKSSRALTAGVRSYALTLLGATTKSNRQIHSTTVPYSLFAPPATTKAAFLFRADSVDYLLRGFPVSFEDIISPFKEGTGFTRDISDQSKDYEDLRTAYGGSDNSSPSFQRHQYVKFNSITKSKDLGQVESLVAELRGKIGTEVGSPTLFFKVESIEPAKISFTKLAGGNKYDERSISIGLLDADRKPIPLSDLGAASPYKTEAERTASTEGVSQQDFTFMPAGVYYFAVSCTQWQSAAYGVRIFIGGTAQLSGVSTFDLEPTSRVAQSYLSGTASLTGPSLGNIATTRLIEGAAEGTLTPTLALTRTSPYSTT